MKVTTVEREPVGSCDPSEACRLLLRRAFAQGRREHSGLDLSEEVYVERAWEGVFRRAARLGAAVGSVPLTALVERLAAADLYLALACEEDVDGAWRALAARYESRLRGLGVRRGQSAADAEELVANLLGDLIAAPGRGSGSSRLASYEGAGTLWSWLAVILVRRIAERGAERGAELADLQGDPAVPEPCRLVQDEEERSLLRSVLGAAWGELGDREALALLYKYRDGLSQRCIARIFGVGEPRVSRILGSAIERLRAGLRGRLGMLGSVAAESTWEALRDLLGERLQDSGATTDDPSRRREQREPV